LARVARAEVDEPDRYRDRLELASAAPMSEDDMFANPSWK
jgi:hypothetical protein